MEDIQKDNEVISLKKILVNYINHWRLFLITGVISLIPAILYLVLYPKTYEMFSLIRLQEDKDLGSGGGMGLGEAAGLMRSFGLGNKGVTSLNVDDEIATLTSNRLLSKVVLKLGLDVSYEKPYSFERLYVDNLPIKVEPDSLFRSNLDRVISLSLSLSKDEIGRIDSKEIDITFDSLPVILDFPEGKIQILSLNKPLTNDVNLNIKILPVGWVAENLSKQINVEEYSKNSNTIELSVEDHNKQRGKDILNVLVAEFNKSACSIKEKENRKSIEFLDGRISNIVSQLFEKEQEIEKYKLKNKMTDIEYDVLFYSEAVKSYREKIIELEAQSQIVNLLEKYVKDPKNKYNLIPAILSAGDAEKGGAISLYNEALIEREKMYKTSKDKNPLTEVADKQIDKLREGVLASISNARESIDFVMYDLKNKEQEILEKVGEVPTYEREYLDLKRQQEILQGVYLVLLQKKEEIALSEGSDRERGYLTDPAFVKQSPVAPRKLFAAIFIVLLTVIFPIAYLACKKNFTELLEEYKKEKGIM